MADSFTYHKSEAFAESVHLRKLAEKYGTPLYVYSLAQIVDRCEAIRLAFSSYPTLICFAVKANPNLSILDLIFQNGLGADIVSIGELERALKAGATEDSIVFSGVGKKRDEIERALAVGVFSINVESIEELKQIAVIARRQAQTA